MSIELEKLHLISEKVTALIDIKNQQSNEIRRLNEKLQALKEEKYTLTNLNSNLVKEIELLKTIDNASSEKNNKLDEAKISGLIKEIEECLVLLKS